MAVLYGGPSEEHEVSVMSGRMVLRALSEQGHHEVSAVLLSKDGPWRLWRAGTETAHGGVPSGVPDAMAGDALAGLSLLRNVDVCFLALHGMYGEGGILQGALEAVGIPYTGSGPLASALAIHKPLARQLFEAAGLQVSPGREVRLGPLWDQDLERLLAQVPGPWVVKPATGGSSVGVTFVDHPKDLAAACKQATAMGSAGALVEQKVVGAEVTCAVVDSPSGVPEALPVIMIRPRLGTFFDYASKYQEGGSDEICPAPLSDASTRAVKEAALQVHNILGCRGMSRTDMFLPDRGDGPIVLEANTIPGMTPQSLLPRAARAAGIPFHEVLERLLTGATRRL